jgi:hypothetical protein
VVWSLSYPFMQQCRRRGFLGTPRILRTTHVGSASRARNCGVFARGGNGECNRHLPSTKVAAIAPANARALAPHHGSPERASKRKVLDAGSRIACDCHRCRHGRAHCA